MFYQLKSTNDGLGFQKRARREHGVGTDAASVTDERTQLVHPCRDALPIDMDIHRVVLTFVVVVAKDGTCLDVHAVANITRYAHARKDATA